MLPLLFRTQLHSLPGRGCVDSLSPEPNSSHHQERVRDCSFSTLLEGAVSNSATPPLAPWPLAATDAGQQRSTAPPAAETRIDRDRRHGSRRRQRD